LCYGIGVRCKKSKASKEELFVECMLAAAENYMAGTLKHLNAASADPAVALFDFGKSFLNFICSPEQLEVRRLMIAEATRSGTGKLFFDKISVLRAHVSAFMSACMASGTLRRDDPAIITGSHCNPPPRDRRIGALQRWQGCI